MSLTLRRHVPAGAAPPPAGARPRRPAAVLLATVALGAFGWTSGGFEAAGGLAVRFFEAYVEAQRAMLAAADNVGADGRAEYAVLPAPGADLDDLRALAAATPGVEFRRESGLAGWGIVAVAPGERTGLERLRDDRRTRFVLPNRGLWICH